MSGSPVIVYVPGLKPKPEEDLHREQLLRCLRAGVRRLDAQVDSEIGKDGAFELVSWTYDFYGEHRDIKQDLADIDSVIAREHASEEDVRTATSLKRRLAIRLFQAADYLPFILPKLATEEIEVHLRDYFRYVHDNQGTAEGARERLKTVLRDAATERRPVLLLAHSMGSVISFDALWQLSREERCDASVDCLVTTGSPLGQKIVQRHLLGRHESGERRYPGNIGDWVNIAAIGELTAIDRTLRNDFSPMIRLGLVEDIKDREVFNYYHMHGSLNVHAEYGYLVNEVTARYISDWWRARAGEGPLRPDRD